MTQSRSRRSFLTSVGQGTLLATLGPAFAVDLGLVPKAFAEELDSTLRFGDLEPLVEYLEIGILVLDDDGHLVREPVFQRVVHLHALRACAERNVEMMIARQVAHAAHLVHGGAHNAAQSRLRQGVKADVILPGSRCPLQRALPRLDSRARLSLRSGKTPSSQRRTAVACLVSLER